MPGLRYCSSDSLCVCVCVCVCGMRVCVRACVRAYVGACVRAARVCVPVCGEESLRVPFVTGLCCSPQDHYVGLGKKRKEKTDYPSSCSDSRHRSCKAPHTDTGCWGAAILSLVHTSAAASSPKNNNNRGFFIF